MANNSWHFSRRVLAESYLSSLEMGMQSLAIFAERRKGKTEFLSYDLAPLAEEKGFRVAYINFWENRSDPAVSIINGVTRCLQKEFTGSLRGWKKEVSVKLGAIQAKLTKDVESRVTSANEALDCLMASKGGVLLLCDEIQHLATNPGFEDLVAALRTFIDRNKQRIRVVYTGSSQDNLNRLFKHQRAAFYNSASLVHFPDMGADFIQFLVDRFEYITRRKISAEKVMRVFSDQYYSPAFVVELLQTMVRDGIFDISEGMESYHKLNDPDIDNKAIWSELNALDCEVVRFLSESGDKPIYHQEVYQRFSDAIGTTVRKGAVQSSINRLRKQGVINNLGRGQWSFESISFKCFVQEQGR